MDILGALAAPFQGENLSILYITMSILVMLVVILPCC